MMMGAAPVDAILSLIMTAYPCAVIYYLKQEKFATEIVLRTARTKTRVPSMPWSELRQRVTQTVITPQFPPVLPQMAVALLDATTSTMMIVPLSALIM